MRILHVALTVRDVKRNAACYRALLDLTEVIRGAAFSWAVHSGSPVSRRRRGPLGERAPYRDGPPCLRGVVKGRTPSAGSTPAGSAEFCLLASPRRRSRSSCSGIPASSWSSGFRRRDGSFISGLRPSVHVTVRPRGRKQRQRAAGQRMSTSQRSRPSPTSPVIAVASQWQGRSPRLIPRPPHAVVVRPALLSGDACSFGPCCAHPRCTGARRSATPGYGTVRSRARDRGRPNAA
jgi:hypothetical protein